MFDKFLVWGNPISHSLSPQVHAIFAAQRGEKIDYGRRGENMDIEQFTQAFNNFFSCEGGKGCNVTSPFKPVVYDLIPNRSECCQLAQACNTVIRREDGSLYAENTDGYGLITDLKDLGWLAINAKVLILGAGGAVTGVLFNILQEGASVDIYNRTPEKVHDIVARFGKYGDVQFVPDYDLNNYDLVINSVPYTANTPVVLKTTSIKNPETKFYDIQYSRVGTTQFLSYIQQIGALPENTIDGLGMLVKQAALSHFYWFGVMPNTDGIVDKLRAFLLEQAKKAQA